ncbi:MAG: alanine/glycine:cation symporter family protein, partial [bacterium]
MRLIDPIVEMLWSMPTFIILMGVGILFSVWSKFIQFRAITHGIAVLQGKYDDKNDPGAINHFQALSAALSGTVGLGNIGGVALAISMGGPGALFWMWVTGFLGMAIKAMEVTLAMIYRDVTDPDNPRGGAMYVVTRGLGANAGPVGRALSWLLAVCFCLTVLLATMTGGNMFQSANVAMITTQYFGIPGIVTGIILAVGTAVVILGGIQRIGDVAGRLVPLMCGLYLLSGLAVLVVKSADVPALLAMVVREAFSPTTAQGAFLGATAWFGLTTGLRRALFSNEAGQGTSPMAHSAAKTREPVREGIVAGLEPFVDTCVVCTLTALVILVTGTWNRESMGLLKGEVKVVSENGVTRVQGPASVDALPVPAGESAWIEGQNFFLIGQVPEVQANTGDKLVKIKGSVVAQGGSLAIQWAEPLPGSELKGEPAVYRDLLGAALTGLAYDRAIPGLGKWMVTLVCWMFAYSTLISWSFYGETASVFLFGKYAVMPYRLIYCLATAAITLPGMIETEKDLGNLSDLGTGFMLLANVPIILIMSPRAIKALREYLRKLDAGAFGGG